MSDDQPGCNAEPVRTGSDRSVKKTVIADAELHPGKTESMFSPSDDFNLLPIQLIG